jgi:hypothetical protein
MNAAAVFLYVFSFSFFFDILLFIYYLISYFLGYEHLFAVEELLAKRTAGQMVFFKGDPAHSPLFRRGSQWSV